MRNLARWTLSLALLIAPLAAGVAPVKRPISYLGGSSGRAAAAASAARHRAGATTPAAGPRVYASSALLVDASDGDVLYAKNPGTTTPIASLTKLMTALVVIDAHLPMDEPVTVTQEDVDTLRNSNSRLPVGWVLSRWDLLHLAVMASENRAAFALARTYPGGREACVAAMNRKARFLGMRDSAFYDPTGLDGRNVSTALDVARLVRAAAGYETVRRLSTSPDFRARSLASGRSRLFGNTNALIHRSDWDILVTKTGFINEAGYCLAMEADVEGRPLIFVILDGRGKASRLADAERLKSWVQGRAGAAPPLVAAAHGRHPDGIQSGG